MYLRINENLMLVLILLIIALSLYFSDISGKAKEIASSQKCAEVTKAAIAASAPLPTCRI